MGTAGDAYEQNWPNIQVDLEDLNSCAQLSTTVRTRVDLLIALRILNLGTRWRWEVGFTTLPLYPRAESSPPPEHIGWRVRWVSEASVGIMENISP